MKEKDAREIGCKQAVKSVFVLVIIAELFWMISETNRDFANGILFYMHYHKNIFILLFYLILFGFT